ncbi:hypothetical protein L950_0217035 [Sphingobacterium sp. IITKGP-BTPF85]|nr:hypothetical protein L950_0217035 [Sphingobacterium sp. IITKGP-BTPF85]
MAFGASAKFGVAFAGAGFATGFDAVAAGLLAVVAFGASATFGVAFAGAGFAAGFDAVATGLLTVVDLGASVTFGATFGGSSLATGFDAVATGLLAVTGLVAFGLSSSFFTSIFFSATALISFFLLLETSPFFKDLLSFNFFFLFLSDLIASSFLLEVTRLIVSST